MEIVYIASSTLCWKRDRTHIYSESHLVLEYMLGDSAPSFTNRLASDRQIHTEPSLLIHLWIHRSCVCGHLRAPDKFSQAEEAHNIFEDRCCDMAWRASQEWFENGTGTERSTRPLGLAIHMYLSVKKAIIHRDTYHKRLLSNLPWKHRYASRHRKRTSPRLRGILLATRGATISRVRNA